MNKVILIGRLSRDPELRTTPSNISVATFSIAVSRPYSPQAGGQPETDFINCVVWRRQAENLAKYCHKGSQIAVEGRIQNRNYTAQDGTKRYITEIICDNITFLGSKSDNGGNAYSGYNNRAYGSNDNEGYGAPQPFDAGESANYSNSYGASNESISDMPTTDLSQDPFKDFGDEITLSDDDLPF